MNLTDYIKTEHIVFLDETEKLDVIRHLVEQAALLCLIKDKAGFEAAVNQREVMSSTGIGMGIAIPHGRCPGIRDFFIITGIARKPVEWQALDYAPVKVIFLIGIPEGPPSPGKDTAKRYLEIIAQLMLLVKHPQRRQVLFSAAEPADLARILSDQ